MTRARARIDIRYLDGEPYMHAGDLVAFCEHLSRLGAEEGLTEFSRVATAMADEIQKTIYAKAARR